VRPGSTFSDSQSLGKKIENQQQMYRKKKMFFPRAMHLSFNLKNNLSFFPILFPLRYKKKRLVLFYEEKNSKVI
jgi:hypothetical protein